MTPGSVTGSCQTSPVPPGNRGTDILNNRPPDNTSKNPIASLIQVTASIDIDGLSVMGKYHGQIMEMNSLIDQVLTRPRQIRIAFLGPFSIRVSLQNGLP